MKIKLFTPKIPKNIKNLSWKQAKQKYPLMKPYGDADRDGLKNFRDCKPFDWKRKGERHKDYDEDKAISFEHIKDLETVGDIKKLEEDY